MTMANEQTKSVLASLFMTLAKAVDDGAFKHEAVCSFAADAIKIIGLEKWAEKNTIAEWKKRLEMDKKKSSSKSRSTAKSTPRRGTSIASTEERIDSKKKKYKYVVRMRASGRARTCTREGDEQPSPNGRIGVRPSQTNRDVQQLSSAKKRCMVLEEAFGRKPRVALADEAYQEMHDEPFEQWTVLAVMGLYLELWTNKYDGCQWAGAVGELYREIKLFVDRVTPRTAVAAVKAVFSKDLAWVKTDQLSFLLNANTYTKYVVPIIALQRKGHGEQSEWSGERQKAGAKKVKL